MLSKPHVSAYGRSDTGLKRSVNEDAYFIDAASGCLVVADGVGGAAAGEVASALFVDSVATNLSGRKLATEDDAAVAIKEIFLEANAAIITHATRHPDRAGMACTAEILILLSQRFVLGHVGDSRTYRFRDGCLVRLTRDHSFVQQQLDLGRISEAEAKTHRYRNVIVRAVGSDESLDVDIIRGAAQSGDIFLLCSDGLTDMVAEHDIAACLADGQELKDAVAYLVERANAAGGKDNITVVLASLP
ncbi:MAG: Stp1/IreP family PP2C-type Ser/Thr phosphatase [Desulfofustis sp.]|nr:Stp1/IreP family PP2C-type Ser/Thr phosphatase [Desulfofustis sp.]